MQVTPLPSDSQAFLSQPRCRPSNYCQSSRPCQFSEAAILFTVPSRCLGWRWLRTSVTLGDERPRRGSGEAKSSVGSMRLASDLSLSGEGMEGAGSPTDLRERLFLPIVGLKCETRSVHRTVNQKGHNYVLWPFCSIELPSNQLELRGGRRSQRTLILVSVGLKMQSGH